jgi:flagellar basal-body rod protein FlgB
MMAATVMMRRGVAIMPDSIRAVPTMKILERSLDLFAQRHQVLLGNVANEETPRYKAKDLEFQSVLASAVDGAPSLVAMTRPTASPDPRHLQLPVQQDAMSSPTLIDLPRTSIGLDGNTVSIEKTMAALHDNSLRYSAASQILTRKYQTLLAAIRESR